ncbi:hypothetical protein SLEP1_g20290 [Rubroshorea leprosula]|uniref:Uncharacterized protein n=1 Tax=Rubroshorea leprosula TaxID=152421 RepID=A0AAV5JBD3_9ROSI|nr:hypothetical protein SLEP1_g20290 [Rubroshorea leprosula]
MDREPSSSSPRFSRFPSLPTNQPAATCRTIISHPPLLPRTSLALAPALHRAWPQSRAFCTISPALSALESPALCTSHHRQSCPARPSHHTPLRPSAARNPLPFCARIACTLHQPSPAIMPCMPEPSYPPYAPLLHRALPLLPDLASCTSLALRPNLMPLPSAHYSHTKK